jgi:hypothetical protein
VLTILSSAAVMATVCLHFVQVLQQVVYEDIKEVVTLGTLGRLARLRTSLWLSINDGRAR